MASLETKLQQHLSLLKQEYSKLQKKHNELENKYNALSAGRDNASEETFAHRLVKTVEELFNSPTYSDIKILLQDREIFAHKIVLNSRSNKWSESVLSEKMFLDWTDIEPEIAYAIVRWIYTSSVHTQSTELMLGLIVKAYEFNLINLVGICEQYLISNVDIRTCVKFYTVAEEVGAKNLLDYCSGLISANWDDLNSSDFEHMSGPLLYKMLRNKTGLPLHSAVRLAREDVIFLCLVDTSSGIKDIVNIWSQQDELPLDLALRTRNESIASTLVQHSANVNIRDNMGDPLLHRAIKHEDFFAANFLLDQNCDVTLVTRNESDNALHLVAGSTDLEQSSVLAEKLIDKNIDINAQNRFGFTPLHLAIKVDNRPIFDLLLKQSEININLKNEDGHGALYYALTKYESDDSSKDTYASILMEHDVQLNPVYSKTGNNLLQVLTLTEREHAAVFLAQHILNTNHVNFEGETALHVACQKNCSKLLRILLENGSNPNLLTNEKRQSIVHYAVLYNAADCIACSVEHNENIKTKKYKDVDIPHIEVNFNIRDFDGDTALSLALKTGYNHLVPALIDAGGDVNVRDANYFTLLHKAIMKEDGKTAIFLLDHGADINAETADLETPLQLAIHCRLEEVVDALCSRGVDMSALDRAGNCPLWAALDTRQEQLAGILVRHGADTDCWGPGPEDCRQTLLHRAIDENREDIAVFLIQAGADLNSPRLPGPNGEGGDIAADGSSPLHLCCPWGLCTVVRTLIEHRANVNSRDAENKTPLHIAIENQQHDIISLLLTVPEVDVSLRDKSGLSPFATALTFKNDKAAQAILERMPSAAEQFDNKGHNFLHTAIKKGDIESALFLLTVQVDVNSRIHDNVMTPPIHLAARQGNETLVRSLILAGARVNDRDAHKRTALHVAAEAGNTSATSALIQNGADVDAVDAESENALHIAVKEGHLAVVRVLLTESTIDAEAMNLKGRNPLHSLCVYGKDNSATICELFLECMPNYPINKPDILGNTPLLLAYMKGNANLCKTLVKAKACLGCENNERVTIFNYQVPSKTLLNRLLDQLSQAAEWTSSDSCQECGKPFKLTVRIHHCRHCGRSLCGKCSDQEVPIIKFSESKPVRVCKICFDVLSGISN